MPEQKLNFVRPSRTPKGDKRLLAIFDGGNAPGYSSVAVAITEQASRRGYELWAATQGFRSLTSDSTRDMAFERLTVHRKERYELLAKGIPARSMGRRVQDPGCDFRSERYEGFLEHDKRDEAAAMFWQQGFTHVICVGGNGTLEGCKAWLESFGEQRPSVGFVNVSVDNDVAGDRAIGFLTGVEAGSTIARGLYEDAYTHQRIYLLSMMGNRSGRHALHCGVASRAHLIVLPFFRFPGPVIEEIADALGSAEMAVVVVAQGYEKEARDLESPRVSASHYLKRQLEQFGLRDRKEKRVIAESFSRYLRGVRPGFADVSAAYLKTSLLFDAFDEERTEIMPFILGAHDVGVRAFADITRDDRVERTFLPLLERFGLPKLQAWVAENHASDERTI